MPILGEIRMFAGAVAPAQWALCDGALLWVTEYEGLFELIGTTYGGDGTQFFCLPDLRGRVPVHTGRGKSLTFRFVGEAGGLERAPLPLSAIPSHSHQPQGRESVGGEVSPAGATWAGSEGLALYASGPADLLMNQDTIESVGGGQPHPNLMPYLCINFIIALYGSAPVPT